MHLELSRDNRGDDMGEQSKTSATKPMQGEGNREADREYREAASKHAQSPGVEREAREAEEALDGEEGKELEDAAKSGKARAQGPASR
jgi:hypothetical protein